jgi:hypothetical protein
MYNARIELSQHVAHLAHPLQQLSVRDEIPVEALYRRAGERNWGDRDNRPYLL